jgi:hypothetical protein
MRLASWTIRDAARLLEAYESPRHGSTIFFDNHEWWSIEGLRRQIGSQDCHDTYATSGFLVPRCEGLVGAAHALSDLATGGVPGVTIWSSDVKVPDQQDRRR